MSVKDCDSHKLMYHPEYVVKWLNNGTVPIHAEVGITNRCNHKCKFCVLDWTTHGQVDIEKDIFSGTLKDMSEMGVKSVYYAGEGEPTLHKDFAYFIEYGKSMGMSQALSTNGTLLNSEMAGKILKHMSWIRFSIDAGTSNTYSAIHGVAPGFYDKVLQNIKDCVRIKKENNYDVDIGVQMVLMTDNINEAEILGRWCKDEGVDNFQVKPAHNHPKSSFTTGIYKFVHDSLQENLEKLQNDDFTVVVRVKSAERLNMDKDYVECHGFHYYVIIDAMGNIIPCAIFYNEPGYMYGNLHKNSFKEIWTGQRRLDIIQKIADRKFCTCGKYACRLDVLNRYLQRVKYPERNDEFI